MSGKNQHWGSTLDDFLHEEGIYEAAKEEAATRAIKLDASCLVPNNDTIETMNAARRGELITAGKPDVLLEELKAGTKTKNKTTQPKNT
jgi:hypothetical protein